MPRFLDHYFRENTLYLPIHFDHISVNEVGEIEIGIPMKYLPELVEHDVVKLSRDGKTFKTLKEAYEHYDTLTEAKKKNYPQDKMKITVTDPETGITRDFEVSAGNAKLGGDTVLLNMSSAGHCMSAIIGTCKLAANGTCYALRFEKQWKGSEKKNLRHEEQWACLTARGIAQGLKKIEEALPAIKYIRINEAGEFRNLPADPEMLAKVPDAMKAELAGVDDVTKLKQVGEELLKLGSKLTLYTYTHRIDLDVGDLGPNICINGSGHMIDNNFVPLELSDYNKVMDMIANKTLKEFNGEPVRRAVPCLGDCRKCPFCKRKEGKHIFLPIHDHGTSYQKVLKKMITDMVKNPEFANIVVADGTPEEKAEKVYALFSKDDIKKFTRMVRIREDRIGIFRDIIKSNGDKEVLSKAIQTFIEKQKAGNADGSFDSIITDEKATEALAKSIDALSGKFEKAIKQATELGQAPAMEKWGDLIKALNKAMTQAQSGKKPKVTGALAKQHAGLYKRIKKEIGSNE